uniref:DJ-1/PfpI domain-containing protein n=1 Tax=Trichogramma kaykai TaxID=54128 RepID=A0ABD2VUT8_9HYME
MWPSFSSLKCLAAGASRFVVARKTTPVSNLLLHTSAANKESGCSPCQSNEDAWISQPGYIEPCADQNEQVRGRVAVVLCGCGYFDGSDPLEVIPLCVHLNRHGFTPVFFAPNKQFCSKWNYLDMFWNERGQGEQFDMAVEAARVPGHPVQDLRVLAETACNYRGLIIPGGQGVLRNLSAIMDRRANLVRVPTRTDVPPMNTDLSNALQTFNSGGLPIGCISYAGFLVAQQFPGVRVTVGNYRRPINATGTRNDPSDLAMITWESALFYATAFGVNIIPQEDEYVMRCSTYNVYSTAGSLSENMSYYATHQNIDRLVHDMLILFGGGSEDGSHPTEALSLAIDLDRRGVQTDFFAPNCKVPKVYDHQEKKESPENRNCLTESTRMAPVTPIYREDAAYGRGYLVNVDHPQPVLCGFGNLDGSDPYQVMSLAINLGRRGFIPTYYAPNATFCDVVDYITRQAPSKPKPAPPQNSNNTAAQDCNAEAQPTSYLPDKCDAASEKPEPRHFMKESARLTSAPVADLGELEKSVKKFAGLIIPGGRGVIDHLIKNEPGRRAAEMDLIPELGCAIQAFGRERKPIGCIADAGILLAKSFPGSEITFGPAKTNELENDPTQDFALTLEDWRQFLIKYATDFGAHPVYRDMMEVKHFEDERVNCYTTPGSLGIYPTCARVFASVANLVEDMECDLKRAGAPSSSASASS